LSNLKEPEYEEVIYADMYDISTIPRISSSKTTNKIWQGSPPGFGVD
jgi:hypothetical protein